MLYSFRDPSGQRLERYAQRRACPMRPQQTSKHSATRRVCMTYCFNAGHNRLKPFSFVIMSALVIGLRKIISEGVSRGWPLCGLVYATTLLSWSLISVVLPVTTTCKEGSEWIHKGDGRDGSAFKSLDWWSKIDHLQYTLKICAGVDFNPKVPHYGVGFAYTQYGCTKTRVATVRAH